MKPNPFVPLKTQISRERGGRDVALSCASPLTQIPQAGGIKGQEVTSDPPLEEVSSLASRGFSRSRRSWDGLEGTRATGSPCPGTWPSSQERDTKGNSPPAPLLQEINHFSLVKGTAEFCCWDKAHHAPSQPSSAPPGWIFGSPGNLVALPRQRLWGSRRLCPPQQGSHGTSGVKTEQLFHLVPLKRHLRHPLVLSPMCSTPPAGWAGPRDGWSRLK